MIKDVFVLSKDAWHVRLMKEVWGYSYYDFRNMCPYFWLSVFNVLIALPLWLPIKFMIIKGIVPVIEALVDLLTQWTTEYQHRCERIREEQHKKMVEDIRNNRDQSEYVRDYIYSSNSLGGTPFRKRLPPGYRDKIFAALRDASDWSYEKIGLMLHNAEKEREERLKEYLHLREKEEERQALARKQRAVRIGQLTVMFKKFFTGVAMVLITIVTGFAGWGLYWLIKRIILHIDQVLKVILIFIVGGLSIAIVGVSLYYTFRGIRYLWCIYGEYCVPCRERREMLAKALSMIIVVFFSPIVLMNIERNTVKPGFIPLPFVYLWKGLVTCWEIIVAFKDNNCPAIEWKE